MCFVSVTCRVDNDCFLGHICLSNTCLIGCRANEDCASSEACINNMCKSPCEKDSVCGPNAECSVVNYRAQCTCPSGFIPNPSANVACVREPRPCYLNSDCIDGFSCVGGTCLAICSSSSNCLANEMCGDDSTCKSVCRRDDDCRSGEICENLMCLVGCRADNECPDDQSCVNNQCQDPCANPTVCGNNAVCSVDLHQVVCKCEDGLEGDPFVNCRAKITRCDSNLQCPRSTICFAETCRAECSDDNSCFDNERCVDGVCKEICSSDFQCTSGTICQGRLCVTGCRRDSSCPEGQSCINSQCVNPCPSACGECSNCEVFNNKAQCSCPADSIGNPYVACHKPSLACSSSGDCDDDDECNSGYCSKSCSSSSDCQCGQVCNEGECKAQCTKSTECSQGFLCISGICTAGCRTNNDCPSTQSCINSKCKDPCDEKPCGTNAVCRASDNRAVCLCPKNYIGIPTVECVKSECSRDADCRHTEKCSSGKCVNLCEEGKCGLNAQCNVVNRRAECSCPSNYYGNPSVECVIDENECLQDPCANNARCTNTIGSFVCACNTGCHGDPFNAGCNCPVSQLSPCASARCGANAKCRTAFNNRAECYCPTNNPLGNPDIECEYKWSTNIFILLNYVILQLNPINCIWGYYSFVVSLLSFRSIRLQAKWMRIGS